MNNKKEVLPEIVEYFSELIYNAFRNNKNAYNNPYWRGLAEMLREDFRVCVRAMFHKLDELGALDEGTGKVNRPEQWEEMMKKGKELLDHVKSQLGVKL